MSEDALLTGKLEPTNEPYAIAKIAGIKMCESYNRHVFLVVSWLSFFSQKSLQFRFSLIFDGTTRTAETVAIVLRFVKDSKIQQRLIALPMLANSLNGVELASLIMDTLREFNLDQKFCFASMRDRASTNEVVRASANIFYLDCLLFIRVCSFSSGCVAIALLVHEQC
jgi:hypothetical protein